MDDQSLPNEPESQPPTGTAAEAFAHLAARVETMEQRLDGRLAVIARALEHIAVEKQSIEVPDYNPTLGKINAALAEFAKHMKAFSQSEALNMTPESMAERIIVAAEAARDTDKASIKQAQALLREAHADQMRAIGAVRTKDRQRRHLVYTGIGTALAVSLLLLAYPGWAVSLAPKSWQWPERVATRTMGEPSLWEAGIRLMRAGNPDGWQAIVDAADMRQANRDAIVACERTAEKVKEPVRCNIMIRVMTD
ncbi:MULTISPECIES: DUF6118 family protein [Sphingobium]|jgi:hypothetical protein|uniref:Uncharacterized protein n=1 Tax=Sphingobium yanoikuyae TaxID=13690 RepID=A0A9X7U8I8_SPHYA|nr:MULTISPECIES: DUF6118 family protein [Sphingobium]MAM10071.1 hypothetical protein [Rhizobiaceae bacterium]PZU69017.1 MAG: hypothetical protein DI540_06870 [Sphingobium sp.]QNG44639.1 hypothetical protein H3V42_22715 [Sphingobium yanoikuyae]|tara:strand:- start:15246 stop:16001 length:756 start_codon:yes stop_codon:yes gene_type:complete